MSGVSSVNKCGTCRLYATQLDRTCVVFLFISGRLWIHAASKIPEREIIEAIEEFYRDAYALDGVTDIVFPEHYPTSVLLGLLLNLTHDLRTPPWNVFGSA